MKIFADPLFGNIFLKSDYPEGFKYRKFKKPRPGQKGKAIGIAVPVVGECRETYKFKDGKFAWELTEEQIEKRLGNTREAKDFHYAAIKYAKDHAIMVPAAVIHDRSPFAEHRTLTLENEN